MHYSYLDIQNEILDRKIEEKYHFQINICKIFWPCRNPWPLPGVGVFQGYINFNPYPYPNWPYPRPCGFWNPWQSLYGARMDEINNIEMAQVAGKLNSYPSSLLEYPPNKGQVQNLEVLCVENILTHSCPQESRDMLFRRVHSFYIPPTPGCPFMTSNTPLPAMDVSKHVHNTLDGSYKPTRWELTCIDE